MFENVKLEKGMYHLSGKSFTQALCDMDPDTQYKGGDMEGLDAFERQLKRFDIKVRGENADKVEKFFESTESAVLFPEFIRRGIKQGLDTVILSEIVAAKTATNSTDYRCISVSENNKPYSTATAQGEPMPETNISLSGSMISLTKFGRVVTATYESIRGQRLDLFSALLRSIGVQLGKAIASLAVSTLTTGTAQATMGGSAFNYGELTAFWGKFTDYDLTTLIGSPATIAKILSFDEMSGCTAGGTDGVIKTPFGITLVKSTAVAANKLIGIDKSCALEMIMGSDVVLDSDKLIDRQLDRMALSVTVGFSKIIGGASMVLTIA